MLFISLMWCPSPTHEKIHLQKATAVSLLCVHYLSQVLLIASFRLEAWAQLCWDWFLPHRKLKRKAWTRSENCLTHQVSLILSCALISLFAATLNVGLCGSLVFWPWNTSSIHLWTSSVLWLWDKFLAPDEDIKSSTPLAKKQVTLDLVLLFCQPESSFLSVPPFSLWLDFMPWWCWLLSVFLSPQLSLPGVTALPWPCPWMRYSCHLNLCYFNPISIQLDTGSESFANIACVSAMYCNTVWDHSVTPNDWNSPFCALSVMHLLWLHSGNNSWSLLWPHPAPPPAFS